MKMIVENIVPNQSQVFTLCYKDDSGEINPIADFSDKWKATYLAKKINDLDLVFKLKLCNDRKIEVYQKVLNKLNLLSTFNNLTDAFKGQNIEVNFEVEPPLI